MSGMEIMLYNDEDRKKFSNIAVDLWTLKTVPGSDEKRKEKSYEFIDLYKRNEERFLTLFLDKTDRVIEFNAGYKSPSWHLPSTGALISLNILPVFQLDITNYGAGYAPQPIDKFLECVNLGLSYERFMTKHFRNMNLNKFFMEAKDGFFFISEFYKYCIVDEPISIRDLILEQFISPIEVLKVEDTFDYITEMTKERQKEMGFSLIHVRGTEKNIFNVVALLLDKNGNKLEKNGKKIHTRIFEREDITTLQERGFKGNSRYFLIKSCEFYLRYVKSIVVLKKTKLAKENMEFKDLFNLEKDSFSKSFEMSGNEFIPKNVIQKSYSPIDLYDCIQSKGLGDISMFIDLISDLIHVNLKIFDSQFEKIIASGVSDNNRNIILRYTSDKSFELGGTYSNKDTLANVKFMFEDGKDHIVTHMKRIGLVSIVH
jgi:hypothetical protein